jgi:TonB-linked SusC/RagA family outer membrane protein
MITKSVLVISSFHHCKKISAMKLRMILLLLGAFQIFATLNGQENGNVPLNTKVFLASVSKEASGSYHLSNYSIAGSSIADQQQKVTGRLTDATGNPLPGVTILEKKTTNGTLSDQNGNFSISVSSGNSILVFSYIGYTAQEISVGSQNVINVILKESLSTLDEVVIVGYGTQKKATITGAISDIKGEELNKSPISNLSNAIVGEISGVIAQQTNGGEPGNDASNIYIRGLATTGDAAPLIVIDGVANRPGGLERLNTNDIESVTVLKDASAAIYGAQAANGVILITSKRGKIGEPSISLNLNTGISSLARNPRMTDAATFAQIQNEIQGYNGSDPIWTPAEIQKFKDGSDPINYPNTDWLKLAIKPQGAVTNKLNLSITGGTEKANYYVSLGHINQDGNFKNGALGYKQYNIASNVDVQVTKKLKVSLDVNLREEDRQNSGLSSNFIYQTLIKSPPTKLAVLPNGSPASTALGGDNPLFATTEAYGLTTNTTDVALLSLKFKYDLPVTGFSLDGFTAYDISSYENKAFHKNYKEYALESDGTYSVAKDQPRSLYQDYSGTKSLTYNLKLNFVKNFDKHFINSFISYEQNNSVGDYFGASRVAGFLSDNPTLANLDLGSPVGQSLYGSASAPARRRNLLGRVTYSYADKYLFEFSARYDGSSTFGPGKQYGFFPGTSVGWRISEENFVKDNFSLISNLKLRASYGLLGNDRISPFQYVQLYSIGTGPVFGIDLNRSVGISPGVQPNVNVTWEKAKNYNLGFDLGLFKDKLTFSAEWFMQKRSDLLAVRNLTVPAYTGIVLPDENIGKVQNSGYEISASHKNKIGELNYSVGDNLVYAKNKVIFMDEPLASANFPAYQRLTGHTINSWSRFLSDGIFHSQQEIDAYPHLDGTQPGDIRYVDVNKDGKIDDLDRVAIDNTDIPQITYGLNASVNWKGWGLDILFQGQAKSKHNFVWDTSPGQNYYNSFAEGRWTPDNPNSNKVRAISGGTNTWGSDYWLRDASFIRLKNVELSYTLTAKLLQRIGIKSARLYISGENLFTVTNYEPSVDPEISEFAGAIYPIQKTINFGATITLK